MTLTEFLDSLTPRQMRDMLAFLSGWSDQGFDLACRTAGVPVPELEDAFSGLL